MDQVNPAYVYAAYYLYKYSQQLDLYKYVNNYSKKKLTCCEKHNGFHARKFRAINLKSFEFLHLFLEVSNDIHVRHHLVIGHWIGLAMKSGSSRC